MRWNCSPAAGWSWRSTLSQPGSRCSGHASRPRPPDGSLLDGLDILRLEETERDAHAFSGPKHWHTFDILARKPVSTHPSAPACR